MKKFILILGLIIIALSETNAQQEQQFTAATNYSSLKAGLTQPKNTFLKIMYSPVRNKPVKDYDYYMQKKKNNLTAGLVTLGSGLLLSGIGLITATNGTSIDTDATAAVLFITGAASGIASIPLMIMATVYGHKAKVLVKAQKTGFGVPQNVDKNIMGVTMSLPIGK